MSATGQIDSADLVALAQELVRFPSPQTERMEAEPAVQEFIGNCVAPILAQRGLSGRRDRMGNLIVEMGPSSNECSLLLMTYAMTHPASAMKDPYSGEIVDRGEGRAIRGRSIAEQKGALAAAIVACQRALQMGPLNGRLVFTLSSAGETGRHDAATAILESLGYVPRLGIVALGTNNRVAMAHKGRLDVEIVVRGRATHSSTPWLGVNAIDGASRVLDTLANMPLGDAEHSHLGKASLTSTRIQSLPAATHTVQNEVRMTFDRRLLPGQQPDAALAQIVAALKRIDGPWSIEVTPGPFMYPCEISEDGPLFKAIAKSRQSAGRPPVDVLYSHGALDAGFLGTKDCDAAMWGPGRMEQFHSDEETLLESELVASAEDYLGLIRYCVA
jgi:acetylornithine deacetylase/succinyl-diaminopimelate desuccinylase-like protein